MAVLPRHAPSMTFYPKLNIQHVMVGSRVRIAHHHFRELVSRTGGRVCGTVARVGDQDRREGTADAPETSSQNGELQALVSGSLAACRIPQANLQMDFVHSRHSRFAAMDLSRQESNHLSSRPLLARRCALKYGRYAGALTVGTAYSAS
jgi:hypothetical protein